MGDPQRVIFFPAPTFPACSRWLVKSRSGDWSTEPHRAACRSVGRAYGRPGKAPQYLGYFSEVSSRTRARETRSTSRRVATFEQVLDLVCERFLTASRHCSLIPSVGQDCIRRAGGEPSRRVTKECTDGVLRTRQACSLSGTGDIF